MTCYLNSRVLGFSVVWIYAMVIFRYKLVLLIDMKWRFHATMGSINIHWYHWIQEYTDSLLTLHESATTCDLLDIYALAYLIILSSQVPKKNIGSMYIWFLTGLPSSSHYVKCKKCELFSKKVEFLGHIFSAASIGILSAKVDAIKQWPQPTCIKDMQAFLG